LKVSRELWKDRTVERREGREMLEDT